MKSSLSQDVSKKTLQIQQNPHFPKENTVLFKDI